MAVLRRDKDCGRLWRILFVLSATNACFPNSLCHNIDIVYLHLAYFSLTKSLPAGILNGLSFHMYLYLSSVNSFPKIYYLPYCHEVITDF